ncbi:MAG TPA: cell division protein FtsZ, partial [Gammaproteobacteria bacterium]|nr:cell division protein FtsZ [Gammaproteobacteria bacterium]
KYVDSLITIPNQKLLTVLGKQTTLLDAFKSANQVLQGAVQGIAELITRPGLINVDFADVRTVMAEMGMAMMGTGRGTGEDRAREAAEAAISSPLLEDINLEGAKGILVNVTAGLDLAIGEFDEVGNVVKERAHEDATVVVGTVIDPAMEGEVRVTVVATGLGGVLRQREPDLRVASSNTRQSRVRRSAGIGPVNYSDLESPPVVRRRADEPEDMVEAPKRAVGQSFEYRSDSELLDIPAFLRRQAD